MHSESILERNAETREVSIYGDTVTEERGKHASACFQSGWQRVELSSLSWDEGSFYFSIKKGVLHMLDIKQLRTDFEQIKEKLAHRGEDLADFNKFGELDQKRRRINRENRRIKEPKK
ncbi:hypothetical protein BSAF29S_04122 [Bacillus safensis subsp. safensis]